MEEMTQKWTTITKARQELDLGEKDRMKVLMQYAKGCDELAILLINEANTAFKEIESLMAATQ